MVFMLPSEFMATDDDCEEQDLEEAMAQLNLEPIPATFEKLEDEKRKHLKALFLKGFVDGKPVYLGLAGLFLFLCFELLKNRWKLG
jgi:hypothetical protein